MTSRRNSRRGIGVGPGISNGNAPVVTLDDAPGADFSHDENENTSLFLECEEEPLSVAQKSHHTKKLNDFLEQMKKLETLAAKNARISTKNDGTVVFRTTSETVSTSNVGSAPVTNTVMQPPMATSKNPNYRLLMDPRTGRILGTMTGTGAIQPANPTSSGGIIRAPTPMNRFSLAQQSQPRMANLRHTRPQPSIQRPAPTPVKPAQVVDLTRSTGGSPSTVGNTTGSNMGPAKSRFPALMVHPKPQDVQNNLRRPELDQKVKSLLVMTPAKLTEWLIQQGLVPQEQTEYGQKLKLGMYSDSKKFPNSGGYVWLSDDSRNRYVSVFKGSLFETIIQPPSVLMKMIYHWVCQTSLNNVLTWVKVDHNTIDTFYRHMRCICVATVQEEIINLGGDDKAVELGVISLGTTTTDGNRREVKVEVLGIFERSTGKMRLRATEPVAGSSQAERFARIFKPLPNWIRRDSRIIADFSVDRERLVNMGYGNVFQCSAGAAVKRSENTNAMIMDYLKKVVPRMFQNSLSVLSTTVIQQFLDELTFREVFGKGPLACFDGIVQKISAQTSYTSKKNTTMSTRLRTIADSPFGDWRMTQPASPQPGSVPVPTGIDALPPSLRASVGSIGYHPGMKRSNEITLDYDSGVQVVKKAKTTFTVDLESYYYGTIEGDISVLMSEFKADMAFKCHLCKKVFMNNIEFMKHLSLHVQNDRATAVDLVDLCQCKYCLKDFDDSFSLQKHQDDDHFKTNIPYYDRISGESFTSSAVLVNHMVRNHVRSELPYGCQVCGYRTSIHREAIDHFTEMHDRSDKLQCPRCLKTFSLFSEKGYNSSIAVAFVEHLQSHQDGKRIACKKCCLSFKDEKKLRAHLERDHSSFKGCDGLETYQYLANENPIRMPQPEERGMKIAPKRPKLGQYQQTAFAAQNLEDLAMYDIDQDNSCMECAKKFMSTGHFNAYLCCTKCRYSTCCSRALSIHVQLFHGPKAPVFQLGHPSILPKEIFCVCGFSAKSGNKIAKHLALSGCRTAYPTLEVAKQAVQPMITGNDDDIESFDPNEVMAKAYMAKKPDDDPKVSSKSQGGPLAFLGLQKTTTTTGDIPEKKIIEDKSVDGWSTEPKSKNVEKEIAQSRAEKKIIEDKSVDGWTQDSNSENVEKEATKENEKKKDETSSDEGCAKDTNSKNDGNEIATATDKTEKKIWLNSNLFTQEKKDNASTEGGREEMEQDDNNTENDKNNVMET